MCMGSVAGILVLYMCISQCAALPGNQHLGGKYKVVGPREPQSQAAGIYDIQRHKSAGSQFRV